MNSPYRISCPPENTKEEAMNNIGKYIYKGIVGLVILGIGFFVLDIAYVEGNYSGWKDGFDQGSKYSSPPSHCPANDFLIYTDKIFDANKTFQCPLDGQEMIVREAGYKSYIICRCK